MRNETIHWLILFMALGLLESCTNGNSSVPVGAFPKSHREIIPTTLYYTDTNGDGYYEYINLHDEPIPRLGIEEFNRNFYSSIKYPETARDSGVSGYVVLEVFVDDHGKVEEVNVKKSLSKDCDEIAKNAFLKATEEGYATLRWNAKVVKYRMEVPVGFGINKS